MSSGWRDEIRLPSTTTGISSRQMPPYFSTIGRMTSSGYWLARWNPVMCALRDSRAGDEKRPSADRRDEPLATVDMSEGRKDVVALRQDGGTLRATGDQHTDVIARVRIPHSLVDIESANS
jgi:hypothetical protein